MPSKKGESELAKTIDAWSRARIAPKFLTPYNSAHKEPIKGAPKPILNPSKAIYGKMKI